MMQKFYLGWSALWLAVFAAFTLFGWSLTPTREVKGVPKSVRDNPGTYRSHYIGGK